jgi:hypothetical protein
MLIQKPLLRIKTPPMPCQKLIKKKALMQKKTRLIKLH